MRYIVPYSRISRFMSLSAETVDSKTMYNINSVLDIIQFLLLSCEIDEEWYLSRYPNVAHAISQGGFLVSGAHHFSTSGYFEGYLPFAQESDDRHYPTPFSKIKLRLPAIPMRGRIMTEVDDKFIREIIKGVLVLVPVDATYYLNNYKDVSSGIDQGHFRSAAHHFIHNGYFEGRWPYDMPVDEEWYVKNYDDLKNVHQDDPDFSATRHFRRFGYIEGRQPGPEPTRWVKGV